MTRTSQIMGGNPNCHDLLQVFSEQMILLELEFTPF